jgi:RecJ-like exonuclease
MVTRRFSSEASMSMNSNPDHLKPGDEAEPGTPGAAEDLCDTCGGSGKLDDGKTCPECEGSGRVMRGIGGG